MSPKEFDILDQDTLKTTAFTPIKTLGDVFKKDQDHSLENRITGIVYKVKCKSCSFVYNGEMKMLWDSTGAGHKPGSQATMTQRLNVTCGDVGAWHSSKLVSYSLSSF